MTKSCLSASLPPLNQHIWTCTHTLKSHYNTSNWSLWRRGEHMLIEPIESLEKHTVGRGPARTAAEENMWGPGFPVQDRYRDGACKHVNTDARWCTLFTCSTTLLRYANPTLGCAVVARSVPWYLPTPHFPLFLRAGWALTSTHVHTFCLTSGPVVRCSLTGLDPQRRE